MPAKATGPAPDPAVVDRAADGVGWIAHPEETVERASHALATPDGVWLVDPLDAAGVETLVESLGEVAGVVVLSNHHARDANAFARRHDVPVALPKPMTGVADGLSAPVERVAVGDALGGYELLAVAQTGAIWQEYALYDGTTLVVSESVGGADYQRVGDERPGVMLLRRPTPPRDGLGGLAPERIRCGHGPSVDEDAAAALEEALANARRRLPRALAAHGRKQAGTVLAALRS
ncbi:hypothetical protein BRD02_08210 [Halobacteriales archaeon QS_8_69_73]|nr:MAG: hypothetical protein BRD02_08210 [Halobacteriales archaeon QS_8_69_73]